MINIKDLTIYSEKNKIISGPLNFSIKNNSINCIHGDNGAGKSTFLKFLINPRQKYTGKVITEDLNINYSYLPQFYSNDFQLPISIAEIQNSFNIQNKYLTQDLKSTLVWRNCSGGEKQKILIDILFNTKADVMLLDEPLNNLDEDSKLTFWKSLELILACQKIKSAIVVTHEKPRINHITRIEFK